MARVDIHDRQGSDSGESGAFVYDVERNAFAVLSPAFIAISGWTKSQLEAVGDGWLDCLVDPADHQAIVAYRERLSALNERESAVVRFRLTRPSGESVPVRWAASAMTRGANGQVREVLATLSRESVETRAPAVRGADGGPGSDETKPGGSENEEEERRRLQELGRMTAAVAHDFNNLLTVMATASELAMDDPDNQKDMLDEVIGAVSRARELTGQLLSFSRRRTAQRDQVDLCAIVKESGRMMERLIPESIRLRVTVPNEPMRVFGVGTQLQQVLLNLALNARDAMGASGELTVTLERRAGSMGARDTARLTVTDTGCGMSEVVRAKMLEPFFTTKPQGQGTGLGMATVKQILGQHHGTLDVTSLPGEGTSIVVGLPLARAAYVEKSAEFAVAELKKVTGGRIAVVDDDPAVLSVTRRVLQRAGYSVMAYEHPQQALLAIQTLGADLLLTDMIMPDMVGTELVDLLGASCGPLPLIFMTGYSDHHLQSGRWRDTPVLSKPFGHRELLQVVGDTLRRAEEPRAAKWG